MENLWKKIPNIDNLFCSVNGKLLYPFIKLLFNTTSSHSINNCPVTLKPTPDHLRLDALFVNLSLIFYY